MFIHKSGDVQQSFAGHVKNRHKFNNQHSYTSIAVPSGSHSETNRLRTTLLANTRMNEVAQFNPHYSPLWGWRRGALCVGPSGRNVHTDHTKSTRQP